MKLSPRRSMLCLLRLALLSSPCGRTFAQSAPLDLWSSETQLKIRDTSTLNYSITARTGYFEVYFDSNNNATWADAVAPYAIHNGGKIRIHGYLASPMVGGPYPAIVIGHGHHGRGSPEEAMLGAAYGYVSRSIDAPDHRTGSGPPYRTAGHGTGMDFGRENLECAGPFRELPVPLRVRGHASLDPFREIVRSLPEPLPYRPDPFGCDRGFDGGTVHLLHQRGRRSGEGGGGSGGG